MKFTEGYWSVREGYKVSNPAQVFDVITAEDRVTVFAACRPLRSRSDTLNDATLTIEYSSPQPDIIGVKVWHHRGGPPKRPEFGLNTDKSLKVRISNDEEQVSLSSGRLSVVVHKGEKWLVDYHYDGRRITGNGWKSTGHVVTDKKEIYMREQLDLGVGDQVYGLGERFTPFVKNGQAVDLWNEDGGTSSEKAYKNIPFYLVSSGYGVFTRHSERVSYEIASENVERVQFSVPGEYLEYYIVAGGSPKEALKNYTLLTGRPALPPAWSFGLWLTTSFTTSYDEETVAGFIDGMARRDIPLHVFHFDCFWMKAFQWCDFRWNPEVFPDPEGMLKRLKNRGLRICVWINPYIAQKSYLFDEGLEYGYLLKTPSGEVCQTDDWQAGMALVDFTNPGAAAWYKGKLRALADMGVDCFKTDFGEKIPVDVVYHNGSDPVKMHNYYAYLYNKAVFEALQESRGAGEAVVFARSATAGSQKFPVHWGGDCSATYDSMAETLRGGLSLCLSGFSFWSHDISGFERTASPDVYKRWSAFGLLSTHSRLHGNESYRVPWLFDEEAVDVLRFFTKLKCRLMPYLFAAAAEAADSGIPVMRAMVLEFPEDPACSCLDRQYMLGSSLLAAPIFNREGRVSYYLPEGCWTNIITGEKTEGGRWISEAHGYMSLPLMARPNSVIAFGKVDGRPDYDFAGEAELHVFELAPGKTASAAVCAMDGRRALKAFIKREGDSIEFSYEGGKSPTLVLRGIMNVRDAGGAGCEITGVGAAIAPGPGVKSVQIRIG